MTYRFPGLRITGWSPFCVCVMLMVATVTSAQPPITAMAFTPSATQLVVGSQSQLAIRAWPLLTDTESRAIDIGQILDLQFSPNGKYLLIVGGLPSEQGEWRVVTWPSLVIIASSSDHDDVIYSAAWLSNERFVTGAADNEVIVWQLSTDGPELFQRLSGHSRRVLSVAYCQQAELLISAGVDQSLRVWDAAEDAIPDSPLRILDNHTGLVRDLAVRPGDYTNPFLASASADKTVRVWQPSIGRLVRFARLPVEPLSIAWTMDGDHVAVACVDGKLRIVNANTVKVERELNAIDGWAYKVLAAKDGSFAVGGSAGQLVRIDADPN